MIPKRPERHQTPISPVLFRPTLLNAALAYSHFCDFSVHRWLPSSDCSDTRIEYKHTGWIYCVSIKGDGPLFSVGSTFTLWAGCFLHQNLQPNTIRISTLSHRFSFCFALALLLAFLCCLCLCSHLHSLSLCLSLHLFFPLCSAHFSRTPFPPGSQATKYSDWCRQPGLITNGKQSRAAAVIAWT